jgi:hypothetical protein
MLQGYLAESHSVSTDKFLTLFTLLSFLQFSWFSNAARMFLSHHWPPRLQVSNSLNTYISNALDSGLKPLTQNFKINCSFIWTDAPLLILFVASVSSTLYYSRFYLSIDVSQPYRDFYFFVDHRPSLVGIAHRRHRLPGVGIIHHNLPFHLGRNSHQSLRIGIYSSLYYRGWTSPRTLPGFIYLSTYITLLWHLFTWI